MSSERGLGRRFGLLWTAPSVSGDGMFNVALPLLAASVATSAAGSVSLSRGIPFPIDAVSFLLAGLLIRLMGAGTWYPRVNLRLPAEPGR